MVVRGRWRPTRRNIVPIVDSLSVVHPASILRRFSRVPFRHLIYLLFLDTFVEQFVIARCRLGMYVREADGDGRAARETAEDERETRKIRRRKEEEQRGRQNTERTVSVLTQTGSYRAAQTNKLEPYLELGGANAVDDEARGSEWQRARGVGS